MSDGMARVAPETPVSARLAIPFLALRIAYGGRCGHRRTGMAFII